MGKNKSGLGRSLIRNRFGRQKRSQDSFLHSSELNDGVDWARLSSITEPNNLDEFLATAELAGTEFTAERLNAKLIDPKECIAIETLEEQQSNKIVQDQFKHMLKIPRRPKWNKNTTREELEEKERESFLNWRKILSELQSIEKVILTPFERNLEFWRQLWRVIEKSDILVQIVDARNPLLFRNEDLEKYVKEVSEDKINMVLVNKSDFLTVSQRKVWADYFQKKNVKVVFWSALQKTELPVHKNNENEKSTLQNDFENDGESNNLLDDDKKDSDSEEFNTAQNSDDNDEEFNTAQNSDDNDEFQDCIYVNTESDSEISVSNACSIQNSEKLLNKEELIELFKTFHKGPKVQPGVTTVGLVGYPNVGKSSTINALLQFKKVPVSATPGRTKYFQTIFLEPKLMLCDCPGLVMPSFVTTQAEMIVNGILPIDQLRDHISPIALICQRIPKHILERNYGIILPKPLEIEDANRYPTPEELLHAYGFMRGFMTPRGMPDGPRSSRYILKDYVNGKLLFCLPPPGVGCENFNQYPEPSPDSINKLPTAAQLRATQTEKIIDSKKVDRDFIKPIFTGAHKKGIQQITGYKSITSSQQSNSESTQSLQEKPWKKHYNRNKKEKLRRVYAHLDE